MTRRHRWFFASVVPAIVKDEQTGKIKLIWPPKGRGLTYVKYPPCRRGLGKMDRRDVRAMLREFPRVEHNASA